MPNNTCFVIQPFDKGPFDKRYHGVIAPAIAEAGLDPYRVDLDPASSIPIVEIEKGIRDARLCLADITLDNPNVWFEVGYAIAASKPIILLCTADRKTKFPFDVQHRTIVTYSTESPADFDELKRKIIGKITAEMKKETSLQKISESPLAEVEGLSPQEVVVLAAIAENLFTPDDNVAVAVFKRDVEKAGFTKVAFSIALKLLEGKGFLSFGQFPDFDGEPYTGAKLTEDGWKWILRNEDKFQIKRPPPEEIPF